MPRIARLSVLCLLFSQLLFPAFAQSLFQQGASSVPVVQASASALLDGATSSILGFANGPIVSEQALSLTDRNGLASRRAMWLGGGGSVGYVAPSPHALRAEVQWLRDNPPRDFGNETDLTCIAVSIYHEARNQPRSGQAAVASVILTRSLNQERWGMTPCTVVVPVQFSYLTPDRRFAPIRNMNAWAEAVEIAADVMLSGPDPRLGGADHYHATYVDPVWNRAMDWVVRIDDHIFWRSRPS